MLGCEADMELLRLQEAAHRLGVSYPTLKQWLYRGKIRSVRTPGGHHRIPESEINRVLFEAGPRGARRRKEAPPRGGKQRISAGMGLEQFISGRNQLQGRIVALQTIGLLTKVSLDVGGQTVTAIITRDASRDLRLKVGETAAALIKATEVMIIRPPSPRE